MFDLCLICLKREDRTPFPLATQHNVFTHVCLRSRAEAERRSYEGRGKQEGESGGLRAAAKNSIRQRPPSIPLPENKPDAETEPVGVRGWSDSPAVQFPTAWVPDSTGLTTEAELLLPRCPARLGRGYRLGDPEGLRAHRDYCCPPDRVAASSIARAFDAVQG